MDLTEALCIFNLPLPLSQKSIEDRHRQLLLKYHPDRAPMYSQWCHDRVLEITEAKDLLFENLHYNDNAYWSCQYQRIEEENIRSPMAEQDDNEYLSPQTLSESLWENMQCYYQYGLENGELRNEGVRRFRFRRVIRSMHNLEIQILTQMQNHEELKNSSEWMTLFQFVKCFNQYSKDPFEKGVGHGPPHIKKAFNTVRDAAKGCEVVMKQFFLGHRDLTSKDFQTFYSCLKVLVMLTATYKNLHWSVQGDAMVQWAESFLELVSYYT